MKTLSRCLSLWGLILLVVADASSTQRRCTGKALVAELSNPEDPENCDDNVCGTVSFDCPENVRSKLTQVHYKIRGLTPGKHGLQVHESPVEDDCLSTQGIWNPRNKDHGSNLDSQRRIGDLGNILANADGVAEGMLMAHVPLKGSVGIQGLSVVVYEGEDDLGRGGDNGSRIDGNVGAPSACGNIDRRVDGELKKLKKRKTDEEEKTGKKNKNDDEEKKGKTNKQDEDKKEKKGKKGKTNKKDHDKEEKEGKKNKKDEEEKKGKKNKKDNEDKKGKKNTKDEEDTRTL